MTFTPRERTSLSGRRQFTERFQIAEILPAARGALVLN
jgi:hypothetical protein